MKIPGTTTELAKSTCSQVAKKAEAVLTDIAMDSAEFLGKLKDEIKRLKDREKTHLPDTVWESRAKYNLTREVEHLIPHLPQFQAIQNQPALRKRYETLVEEVLSKALIVDVTKASGTKTVETLEKVDPSTHYMIAASLVEGLYQRPELLSKVLNRSSKLIFALDKRHSIQAGAYIRNNFIRMNKIAPWSLLGKNPTNASLHEFMHALCDIAPELTGAEKEKYLALEKKLSQLGDERKEISFFLKPFHWFKNTSVGYWMYKNLPFRKASVEENVIKSLKAYCKDFIPEMTEAEQKRFAEIQDKLFALQKKETSTLRGKFLHLLRKLGFYEEKGIGIRPYAFSDRVEFLPVTMEYFTANPKALIKTEAGKELYHFYRDFFKIDPLKKEIMA